MNDWTDHISERQQKLLGVLDAIREYLTLYENSLPEWIDNDRRVLTSILCHYAISHWVKDTDVYVQSDVSVTYDEGTQYFPDVEMTLPEEEKILIYPVYYDEKGRLLV